MSNVVKMGSGQFFGMRGLPTGAPSGVTVTAHDGCSTLSISYEEILDTAGFGERQALDRKLRSALRTYVLRQIQNLKGMSDDLFENLLNHIEEVTYHRGQVIYQRHSVLNAVYVLEGGKVIECDLGDPAKLSDVEQLEKQFPLHQTPGETFAMESLTGKNIPVMSSLVAVTDCICLIVPSELCGV